MAGMIILKSGVGRRIVRITTAAAEAEVAAGTAKRVVRGALYTRVGVTPPPPAKPTVTTAPIIAGGPAIGQVLTATPGVYTGSPAVAGQWKRGAADIPGATGATWTAAGAAGDSITYVETATNAGGSITSSSNAIVLTGA